MMMMMMLGEENSCVVERGLHVVDIFGTDTTPRYSTLNISRKLRPSWHTACTLATVKSPRLSKPSVGTQNTIYLKESWIGFNIRIRCTRHKTCWLRGKFACWETNLWSLVSCSRNMCTYVHCISCIE